MPYEFLEHEADIGIRAWGKTLEDAFAEGAKALFDITVDVTKVAAKEAIEVECNAPDIPALFVEWLNTLLTQADIRGLVFGSFRILEILSCRNNLHILRARAFGERLDIKKHSIKVEAKAATYHGLKYEIKDSRHYLQCVVDV